MAAHPAHGPPDRPDRFTGRQGDRQITVRRVPTNVEFHLPFLTFLGQRKPLYLRERSCLLGRLYLNRGRESSEDLTEGVVRPQAKCEKRIGENTVWPENECVARFPTSFGLSWRMASHILTENENNSSSGCYRSCTLWWKSVNLPRCWSPE